MRKTAHYETSRDGIPDGWSGVYPRPHFRRRPESCYLLEDWRLSVVERGGGLTAIGGVRLPFPPESPLSGIGMTLEAGEHWLYRTAFENPFPAHRGRILLHLPPTDQVCIVTLCGKEILRHEGGVLPFSCDVTDGMLRGGPCVLEVCVWDELDTDLPYGKQSKKRGGMWYTPVSGMCGQAWLEAVPESYIADVRVTPGMHTVRLEISAVGAGAECTVLYDTEPTVLSREALASDGGADVLFSENTDGMECCRFDGDCVTINIKNPRKWSPEAPCVYRYTIVRGEDRVQSYFALREISVRTVRGRGLICLNGAPRYFHGLLDQGYFHDGIVLPATPDGYLSDICAIREMGFDTLRKHIKLENPWFYYLCDLTGTVVLQDMVNNGEYRFWRDTALPTLGCRRALFPPLRRRSTERQRRYFLECAEGIAALLYSHACVCGYTVFNEGWGQFDPDGVYRRLRACDPTRIWDATSGWFFGRESDVQSEHVYFRRLALRARGERPLVLSEFGGYACAVEGHLFQSGREYGYKTLRSCDALTQALARLYREEVLPMLKQGLCVTIYTQVSDVEDEINGLLTYDRSVCKADVLVMASLEVELRAVFDTQYGGNGVEDVDSGDV